MAVFGSQYCKDYMADNATLDFGKQITNGDKIGLKTDIENKKVWLYLNGKLITLLWKNIPNFVIPAVSNGGSNPYSGTFTVTKTTHFE